MPPAGAGARSSSVVKSRPVPSDGATYCVQQAGPRLDLSVELITFTACWARDAMHDSELWGIQRSKGTTGNFRDPERHNDLLALRVSAREA